MSSPCIAVIGDIHFRAKEQREGEEYIQACLTAVEDMYPDVIILLGDILDTHEVVRVAPFNQACTLIEKLSDIAPTYVLMGNHDLINGSQFLSEEHAFTPLKKWENVTVVDKPVLVTAGKRTIVMCPYVPPGRFKEALDTCPEWDKADVIFAHQEFRGCAMGGVVSEIGDVWDLGWPPVVSGHIHEEQKVGENVYYTGSSRQVAFGDEDEKGIWQVSWDDTEGEFQLEKTTLDLRGKKTVRLSLEEVEEFDESLLEKFNIKLQLIGKPDAVKTFKKSAKFKSLKSLPNLAITFANVDDVPVVTSSESTKVVSYWDTLYELCGEDDSLKEILRELRESLE